MDAKIHHYIENDSGDFSTWGDFEFYDISASVNADQFPKYMQSEIKGDGYFDFKVSPFTFQVIAHRYGEIHLTTLNDDGDEVACSRLLADCDEVEAKLNIKRHDPIEIKDEKTATVLMQGFVDKVEGWNTSTPKITVYPDFLRWKDIMVGDVETDDDGEDPIYRFTGVDRIDDIVTKLCEYVNAGATKLKTPFEVKPPDGSGDGASIPETAPPSGVSYLGSKLQKRDGNGFQWNLAMLFINAFDGSFIRKLGDADPYSWYYELKDAGVFKRILINQGQWLHINDAQWLNWTLHYPSGLTWTSVGFSLPSIVFDYPCGIAWSGISWCSAHWLGNHISLGNIKPHLSWSAFSFDVPNGTINVPANDVKIPCVGSRHDIYECESGDMAYVAGYTKSIFPIIDSKFHLVTDEDQTIDSLNDTYGSKYTGFDSDVTEAKIKKFVEDEGCVLAGDEVKCAFMLDSYNQYCLIQVKRKAWTYETWMCSFEIPFDFTQRYDFKNATAFDVLKNLAILTNRSAYATSYFDKHVVSLMPKGELGTWNSEVTIPVRYLIARETNMKRDQDVDIKIERVKKDSEGKITDFGFYIREAEFLYMQQFYKDLWNGNLITNNIQVMNASDNNLDQLFLDPKLADEIVIDDNGTLITIGQVIKLQQGTEQSLNKYECQFYHNQEVT